MITPVARHQFRFSDVSDVRRCGIKGAEAADLLRKLGAAVPAQANSVVLLTAPHQGRCLRLGLNEFLLEQHGGTDLIDNVCAALTATDGRHCLAQRCDTSLLLYGPQLFPALREICAYDFESPQARADETVMTLMAGISVTFIRESHGTEQGLRLWCDPTLGQYLRECLLALGAQTSVATSSSVTDH
jgi:hypothetical protein